MSEAITAENLKAAGFGFTEGGQARIRIYEKESEFLNGIDFRNNRFFVWECTDRSRLIEVYPTNMAQIETLKELLTPK